MCFLKYLYSVGDAASQLLNAALFFSGNANESLSGRCHRQRDTFFFGLLYVLINALFWAEENHCRDAYIRDLVRARKLLSRHYGGGFDV